MSETPNKTKKYVALSFGGMVVLSLVVALIMTSNYKKDTSKERYKLTRDYTAEKKKTYTYDAERGKVVYSQICMKCHSADGSGSTYYPPLAGSELVVGDPVKPIKIILNGLTGKITRNGKQYGGTMPGYRNLPHEDLTHVLNYIRNSFGNKAEIVPALELIKGKVDSIEKSGAWKESEL